MMKAHEFDKAFDDGEDMDAHVDWPQARRVNVETKRVNVDFPAWVVAALDRQARVLGVPRQSLIKLWIADRLRETPEVNAPGLAEPAEPYTDGVNPRRGPASDPHPLTLISYDPPGQSLREMTLTLSP